MLINSFVHKSLGLTNNSNNNKLLMCPLQQQQQQQLCCRYLTSVCSLLLTPSPSHLLIFLCTLFILPYRLHCSSIASALKKLFNAGGSDASVCASAGAARRL